MKFMARPLRIEYPGAYYHAMNRGNLWRRLQHCQPEPGASEKKAKIKP